LCAIKITRFAGNTGVAIATIQHHFCADVFSIVQFTRVWADYVRGCQPLEFCQDRGILQGKPTGRHTTPSTVSAATASRKLRKVVILYASAENLAKLKADTQATVPTEGEFSVPWISTLDALGALVTRAHLRLGDPDDKRIVSIPVNLRHRASDRIPVNYFGNGILPAQVSFIAKDVLAQPLGHLAARFRSAINKIDEDEVAIMVDKLAGDPLGWPTPESFIQSMNALDLCLTDWSKAHAYSVDFGYGPPIRFRAAGYMQGPPACFLGMPPSSPETPSMDGMELYAGVVADCFDLFKEDVELNKYLTIHG
jgi:hypothetical protein